MEQREREQQVNGLQHLDDLLGRAAIEIVDVEHDALHGDAARVLERREQRVERPEILAQRGDQAQRRLVTLRCPSLFDEVVDQSALLDPIDLGGRVADHRVGLLDLALKRWIS